jgi:hypothetical protein
LSFFKSLVTIGSFVATRGLWSYSDPDPESTGTVLSGHRSLDRNQLGCDRPVVVSGTGIRDLRFGMEKNQDSEILDKHPRSARLQKVQKV